MTISEEEFREIFGDSDEELDENNSDIDFQGFSDPEENDFDLIEAEIDDQENNTLYDYEIQWSDELSNFEIPEFSGQPGIKVDLADDAEAKHYFFKLFGDDLFDLIVLETNRYARQTLANKPNQLAKWVDVTRAEMKAYFGLCVIMGLNVLPKISDYWSTEPFLGNEAIKQTMARNRFQEISKFLHFADSCVAPKKGQDGFDRLYKVRPVLSTVLKNCQTCYSPRKNIAVDEGMIAFKGRLSFRQYLPAKPTKYGIKVWMAADSSNGYVLNFDIYLGSEEGRRRIHGLGYDVVMNMVKPYLNKQHHVFFDNFFSSPRLLEHLEMQNTFACSTVRCNRKGLPPCASAKINVGELVQAQKGKILFTKWHDKRDVTFLSTNISPDQPSRTVERTIRGKTEQIVKPLVSDIYTKYMGGVDRADQLRSYYYIGRQSRKWYKYLFWFAFNVAACNSYILQCENTRRKRPQEKFLLELGKGLIAGFNSRKRPSTSAALPVIRPMASHLSTKVEGRKKECVHCKAVGRKTKGNNAVQTKYKCMQCNVSLCKTPCFRDYHLGP